MTTDTTALETILDGTAPAEPTGETETTEVVAEAAPPAAEKPPEDKPPPDHVPTRALQDERRKRQELERELAELRQKAEATTAKPNLFEDPDSWEKALDERVEKKLAGVREQSEQRFLALVEQAAKARHKDFEDMAVVFAETAKTTPGLIDEARNAPDPAEFIYQAGRNLKRVQEAGSIEALIERAREEGRQEALKGKVQPKIPESLTDIGSAPSQREQQVFTPKPLTALLPSI